MYNDGFFCDQGLGLYSDEEDMIVGDQDAIINGEDDNLSDQNEIIHGDADIVIHHDDNEQQQEDEQEGNISTMKDIGDQANVFDLYYFSIMKANINRRRVLNLRENSEKQYRLYLSEAYEKACWGSPYGWIVTLGLDRQMELLNPLTKCRLPLPSQETCRYPWREARGRTIRTFNVTRAVLLRLVPSDTTACTHRVTSNADTDHDQWLVVLFHRMHYMVSIAKPGDRSGKEVLIPNDPERHVMRDVIYYSDIHALLFVDTSGNLHYCDIRDTQPQLLKTYYVEGPLDLHPAYNRQPESTFNTCIYIVQSNGDLLILERTRMMPSFWVRDYKTTSFRVYKLDSFTDDWEELHDLNGAALFVGNSVTISVSALDSGCRSNCIYFNDDDRYSYGETKGNLLMINNE